MFTLIIYFIIAAIGFVMLMLYKQTNTTAQIFKPNPRGIVKIFLVVCLTATLTTAILSWLATYVLYSSDIPDANSIKYQNMRSVMVFMINFFFFALIVLANVYTLSLKRLAIVPYLLSLGFYVVFILKDAYYVADYYALWQKSLAMLKGDLPDFHQTAWMKCSLGTIVTFFNAALMWWGVRK